MAQITLQFSPKGGFIELAQLLKTTKSIPTGGMAKLVVRNGEVKLNGVQEFQAGKKVRPGDRVEFENKLIELI